MRILSSYFVAGLEIEKGIVIKAAPILKYMIGWKIEKVQEYCNKKGWKYESSF